MKSMKKMWTILCWVMLVAAVAGWAGREDAYGAQVSGADEPWQNGGGISLDDYDFGEIQRFIDQAGSAGGFSISFKELIKEMLDGNFMDAFQMFVTSLKDGLFSAVSTNTKLMGQIIVLGIISAVFSNFSSVFSSNQISETGFYVTYLLLFTLLASSFFASIAIADQVLGQILGFMKALVPAYFLAVAFSGGSMTSAALYEVTLAGISILEWLCASLFLPLVRVYILLTLAGHMTKEDILSKLTELLGNMIQWGIKSMIGLVLGFHMIQGLVLPYVDSMKNTALQRVVSVIPGIGQGAGTISQIVLGSGVLIKNTMGAAAVVILLILTLIPLLQLMVLMVLYQGVAAVMQPVCDKRFVSCVYDIGKGHRLLIKIVMSALLLFIISIGVVCMSTNTVYFAG